VGKDEDGPAVLFWVCLDGLDKPVELSLVDRDLVRGVCGCAEGCRAHPENKNLWSDLVAELRGLLAKDVEVSLQVCCVGLELIDAFKVVIPADDVIPGASGREKGRENTLSGAWDVKVTNSVQSLD